MAFNSNKSEYSVQTTRTSLTSILKSYQPTEREKAKNAVINRVRFEMPKQKGLLHAVKEAEESQNYAAMDEFVAFLTENSLHDHEFLNIFHDALSLCNQLTPKYTPLVEALLALSWNKRSTEVVKAYSEFCINILVAHNNYLSFAVRKLISLWIPNEPNKDTSLNNEISNELEVIHQLLEKILNAIPMAFDAILDAIESLFPYYKRSSYISYIHNLLKLLEYKPIFTEYIIQLLMEKLAILDVNAPRHEIEDLESDDDNEESEGGEIYNEVIPRQEKAKKEHQSMNHPIAQTLDISMLAVFNFLKKRSSSESSEKETLSDALKFLQILIKAFDAVILPIHNTHHVQFLVFYYCSLKQTLSQVFLASLWNKVTNPNCPALIRQASVGYLSSFLARSAFIHVNIIKLYLKEMCDWCQQYIKGSQLSRSNVSLKSNLVFYSVCQAIFYVIAFRSRDLTVDKKSILFLQSLQLTALVTSTYNPLRVCLPAVATAFAGVTRAYQLAYCHAILERNARRKLATIYANDTATPEEILDTFFPFDPYLLKISGQRISSIYLQYQASDAEECSSHSSTPESINISDRKRDNSEMLGDHDIDDFLPDDKRHKLIATKINQPRDLS
uniref:RNA polymerase I-specific transcription initiation factor RRN3 n=1 Tax=Glossina morsitans morsitans TaxID=37546 RepID=A0A1B0G3J9_GLOMM